MFEVTQITDAELNASRALRFSLRAARLHKHASLARAQRALSKWQDVHSDTRMRLNQQRTFAGVPIVLRPVRTEHVAPMTDADIPF